METQQTEIIIPLTDLDPRFNSAEVQRIAAGNLRSELQNALITAASGNAGNLVIFLNSVLTTPAQAQLLAKLSDDGVSPIVSYAIATNPNIDAEHSNYTSILEHARQFPDDFTHRSRMLKSLQDEPTRPIELSVVDQLWRTAQPNEQKLIKLRVKSNNYTNVNLTRLSDQIYDDMDLLFTNLQEGNIELRHAVEIYKNLNAELLNPDLKHAVEEAEQIKYIADSEKPKVIVAPVSIYNTLVGNHLRKLGCKNVLQSYHVPAPDKTKVISKDLLDILAQEEGNTDFTDDVIRWTFLRDLFVSYMNLQSQILTTEDLENALLNANGIIEQYELTNDRNFNNLSDQILHFGLSRAFSHYPGSSK